MKEIQWLSKIYHKIVVIKKLLWFVVNLFTLVPPFKQLRALLNKVQTRARGLQTKIEQLANSQVPFGYLFQVYKQFCLVVSFVILLAIYAYFKFLKKGKGEKPSQQDKCKISKHFDQLSEQSIIVKNKIVREQQKQDVDSCCEELHNDLNKDLANQDKVFLEILSRYQRMRFQNEEEEPVQKQHSKNNKYTQDNSSDQGTVKQSLQKIPKSSLPKKQTDLNRSSVL